MQAFAEYHPATGWDTKKVAGRWLLICQGQVIPASEDNVLWQQRPEWLDDLEQQSIVTGQQGGINVAISELDQLPENIPALPVRSLLQTTSVEVFSLFSHASQVLQARKLYTFCSCCGGKTNPKEGEWSQQCVICNHVFYPIISPCIIVLIKRGDEVLLVRHQRHGKQSAMHTLIAGFVEPGESAEQAVHREVLEETGLRVRNLEYQFSQSWPFPHSLMMGFHAEYESGELVLDETELCDGGWFHQNNLPELPPKFTISRNLVDIL